jgi:iron complex outermembrane receptor protein
VAKNNFPGSPGAVGFSNPGDLFNFLSVAGNANNLFAIDRFTNLGGVRARTFNINLDYLLRTEHYGDFTFDSTAAIFASYQFQALPGQKFYEYAGTSTNGGTGVQGTLPKYRLYSSLDWQMNDWDVTLANSYIAAVDDLGAGGITYYMTWDLHVAKSFNRTGEMLKSFRVAAGINNIGDAMPPLSPIAFTDNNADVATYSPIGRLFYVSLDTKF